MPRAARRNNRRKDSSRRARCAGLGSARHGPGSMEAERTARPEGVAPAWRSPARTMRARIFIKPRIAAEGFVHRQVHLAARFQDAAIFRKRRFRIAGVVDHAVGDHCADGLIRRAEAGDCRPRPGRPAALRRRCPPTLRCDPDPCSAGRDALGSPARGPGHNRCRRPRFRRPDSQSNRPAAAPGRGVAAARGVRPESNRTDARRKKFLSVLHGLSSMASRPAPAV